MSGTKASSPARIALAILVVVALLATAVGVTIWRYDHALTASDAAQESASEVALSQAAATTFWHEREAMNEYFLLPDAEVLRRGRGAARRVRASSRRSCRPAPTRPRRRSWPVEVVKANDAYVAVFEELRDRPEAALRKLNALEDTVTGPIAELQAIHDEGGGRAIRRRPPTPSARP